MPSQTTRTRWTSPGPATRYVPCSGISSDHSPKANSATPSRNSSLSPPPWSPITTPPRSRSPQSPSSIASNIFQNATPETAEEVIERIITLSTQAGDHLKESRRTDDLDGYYESALALMHVLNTIHLLLDQVQPDQRERPLESGTFRGRNFINVLGAEILSINTRLCIAFREIGRWELIGPRVEEALVMVERSAGRFHVTEAERNWLGEMEEVASEQVEIERRRAAAAQA